MCVAALVVAIVFSLLRPLMYGQTITIEESLAALTFTVPVILIAGPILYPILFQTPKTLVVGENLVVIAQHGEHHIDKGDITSVKMLGGAGYKKTQSKGSALQTRKRITSRFKSGKKQKNYSVIKWVIYRRLF